MNKLENDEIIRILQKNRNIKTVTLQKTKDAESFWESLLDDIYLMDEWTYPKSILRDFPKSDSLELINKNGRLLKRFAKYLLKHDIKLSDSFMGKIGDKLQYYLQNTESTFYVDFTDSFDWNDGQFGHSGSCWWGCYKDSLPTFQDGGGWAIRFYNDNTQKDSNGIGRTWLISQEGYIIGFNSYGVTRPNVSKVIKAIFLEEGIELHYKAIEVQNSNSDTIPYINGGTGFILGLDVSDVSEWDIDLEVEEDNRDICEGCGCRIDEGDGFYANDYIWCESCYCNRFSSCDKCRDSYDNDEVHEVHGSRLYSYLCEYCLEKVNAYQCNDCGEYYIEDCQETDDGNLYCSNCMENHAVYCETCNTWYEDVDTCPECTEDEEDEEDEGEEETTEETTEEDYILPHDVIYDIEDISVASNTRDGQKSGQCSTWRLSGINGIFVYKYSDIFNNNDHLFCVTHERSGLRLHSAKLTLRQAIELMIAVRHINFDCTQEEILRHSQEILDIRQSQGIY